MMKITASSSGPSWTVSFLKRIMEGRRPPIDRLDLVRFEMDVDGMGPPATVVLENPTLRPTLYGPGVIAVRIEEPLVDGPSSVLPLEHKSPRFLDLTDVDAGVIAQGVTGLDRCLRFRTEGLVHDKFHDAGACPLHHIIKLIGPAPIVLAQNVLDEHLGSRKTREVDDDVGALRWSKADGLAADRLGQQPTIVGDLQKVPAGQPERVPACIRAVQETEPVLARLNVELGLGLAVRDLHISQPPIEIILLRLVDQRPVSRDSAVLDHERDVELFVGQDVVVEKILFHLVFEEVKPGQPSIDGLPRDVRCVVVVPLRAREVVPPSKG